ncbi:HAMP domain-containing sensor histidine kinase [Fodinicola feengrottensis]
MRQQVRLAAVLAALIAVAVFAVPLGAAVYRLFVDEERGELARIAGTSVAAVAADPAFRRDEVSLGGLRLPPVEGDITVAVYRRDSRLLAGPPSAVAGGLLPVAAAGQTAEVETAGQVAIAMPVPGAGRTAAIVVVTSSKHDAVTRTGWTWAAMACLALLALGTASLVAGRRASRISAPLGRLAGSARALGDGDFSVRSAGSGIVEIDTVAAALNSTAERLGDLLRRERSFSANASHQLRTPVTGLRLLLELAQSDPDPATVVRAIGVVDQLERTIDDLLAMARSGAPRVLLDIDALLKEVRDAGIGPLSAAGRGLRIERDPELPAATGTLGAVRQAVAVLVDNATVHGAGTIVVRARDAGGAVAIDVQDQGSGLEQDAFDSFGDGLRLARDLVEADGGRLALTRSGPQPIFTLLLPA